MQENTFCKTQSQDPIPTGNEKLETGNYKIVRQTYSVCPVCLKRLPAEIIKRGQEYFLEKECSNHGRFSTVVWRGENFFYNSPSESEDALTNCPEACGLCPSHLQKTCCVLVEVTQRCNLNCTYCFAKSGGDSIDPSLEELSASFKQLVKDGRTFIQLSGGEPTLRDDLPEIVSAAKRAGCENIQLNSNGIRLGEDRNYTKALAQAGLSFVFMQFDGTDDAIYEKLRGRPLFAQKQSAIEACSEEWIGVTLVPTIVPGVNDRHIGEILNFAFDSSPAVRGVHFQPVSYFGRCPEQPCDEDRITLPEILTAIEQQTSGKIHVSDFVPSGCDHPRCGFHGDFMVMPDGIMALSHKKEGGSCCQENAHLKNRNFVARRWKRTPAPLRQICYSSNDIMEMDVFLDRIKSHGFTITGMAFQDAYTLDLERLRQCSLHVYRNGKIIPFCATYLTAETRNR
jgi:uncharacterized radical SAM superfamily Fe-S cluster-containing enzyme